MANWRTAFKSDFLASWDLDANMILTIERVEVKEVQLQKKERKVVAHFFEKQFSNGEPIKPMIMNATNCKLLNSHSGTKETDNWKDIKVEIGVVANTGRIGEANGLKIIRIITTIVVDISFILKSNDVAFVKKEANRILRTLSNEQKEDVRNHITQLENV